MKQIGLLLIAALVFFASCEKSEDAIVLPDGGTATFGSVSMGKDYTSQVFYNLATKSAVFSSDPKSWDLAFESAGDGKHVMMNGGNGIYISRTGTDDFSSVKSLPQGLSITSDEGWIYDDPSGLPEHCGIGDWWAKNPEVLIVRHPSGLYKIKLLSVDAAGYTFDWMPFSGAAAPTHVTLPKDTGASFTYFSFDKGQVHPDPPQKESWDIVFTYYRELVYSTTAGKAVPYFVTGVLLNPHHTSAAADSVRDFNQIDHATATALPLSNKRNVIGYDWKSFGLNTTSLYVVNRRKCYVVSTQKGALYKLHFLDFYGSDGAKGTPSFEYERLY